MPAAANKDKVKKVSDNLFPVVGVGASAGGLEAFKRLLKAIPENSGIAFILVQHLEPTHESILPSLLQKVTTIPVLEITNDVRVERDHIYIIPSNKLLTATDGVLQLSPRPPKNVKNMPIDVFFASLAEVHLDRAIGVVLSGTATDGTKGLRAIKDHGGTTFAQDQQSAAFDGMPQSAVDADVVDFVLTPEEIIGHIVQLKSRLDECAPTGPGGGHQQNEEAYRQILSAVRVRKGSDFTYYKQTTIRRRILRRMGLIKVENVTDYVLLIKGNAEELDMLYQDLLIPVTAFFRDPAVYDRLCGKIFPALLKGRDESDPFRIWSAGCSTGEEPYSLAICLHEYLADNGGCARAQVFATDMSEASVAKARSGAYSSKEVGGLSPERLNKYFTKVNGAFHVNRFIREMCVFACHNFLKDPPFAKMDLVSCRNVLIYMEPFLQKKALATFHYALKDTGYLLLGKSETAGQSARLFSVSRAAEKMYSRSPVPGKAQLAPGSAMDNMGNGKKFPSGKEPAPDDFQKNADQLLLSKFSPPGVVVNGSLDIVQFRGPTGAWLEAPAGKPSLNVLKMAREGLAFELRNALHKSKATNRPVQKDGIVIQAKGSRNPVGIEVMPLLETVEPYFLILFKETVNMAVTQNGLDDKGPQPPGTKESAETALVNRLEMELSQAREDMRAISEDQEAANEELQSANEELLSGSEELQSLNEELETSKEEIQSTNEELTTLNQELFDRNEQLNISRAYAESIVATIREPLIVLDKGLKIRTANRSYYDKFRTSETEAEGKLFYEIGDRQWDVPDLRHLLGEILAHQQKIAGFEIKKGFGLLGERTMLLNAARIFNNDSADQLILLAIEDVTEIRQLEASLKMFTQEQENLVAERTSELRDANSSLRYSNQNLEQFATLASHDLQEPLRKIMTFANLLNLRHSNDIKGESTELLSKISLSAERMSALIKAVLNFSKITESQKDYEWTDLNMIMKDVIADFDLLIAQKKAEIKYGTLPMIDAIPLQMTQLFHNLIGNSLKFSKKGVPPQITVTAGALAAESAQKYPSLDARRPYHEIVFRDNGIGFDAQFSEQIFMIFQRLNSRDNFEGTGIGLALCKKIVVGHHGEIYAEGRMQEGTNFHIILPVKQ